MTVVVALAPDLLDRSRIAAVVPDARFLRSAAELDGVVADVVLVDLARPGVLAALPVLAAAGTRVVGFAAHVDRPLLDAARAAGCGEVLARSAFFARLRSLVPDEI